MNKNELDKFFEIDRTKKVITRFPPEPNGKGLHIGHAKSMYINFMLGDIVNLRMDDTNPTTESMEYVEAIKHDVEWMGFEWDKLTFASDYFDSLYDFAVNLIKKRKAYICELSAEEVKTYMGVPNKPGKESPYRERTVEENLELFARMKSGEYTDGYMTLRAKIDMTSPNLHKRDPILYRIKRHDHYRTGNEWCIYPTYDFAHCLSDAIENITNSICTLEFEVHRPLYNWVINLLIEGDKPIQREFARLNMTYTVMSKRLLKELVDKGTVSGWDDPRMPTISGLRRRGYTAESIKSFCETIGVTKRESLIDISLLENSIRTELNETAGRVMVVLDPLKVTVTNYPEDKVEWMDAVNNPGDESYGKRTIPFTRNLYIERADFMEDAPKKFFRLSEGREVRFKHGYYLTCNEVIKDENGEVIELKCTYDPETKGGWIKGRKVKGTIHWVSADHCVDHEVRLYDRLFKDEVVEDMEKSLNPDSITVVTAKCEPSLEHVVGGMFAANPTTYQFDRTGYFIMDEEGHFNRIVSLRDGWKGN